MRSNVCSLRAVALQQSFGPLFVRHCGLLMNTSIPIIITVIWAPNVAAAVTLRLAALGHCSLQTRQQQEHIGTMNSCKFCATTVKSPSSHRVYEVLSSRDREPHEIKGLVRFTTPRRTKNPDAFMLSVIGDGRTDGRTGVQVYSVQIITS